MVSMNGLTLIKIIKYIYITLAYKETPTRNNLNSKKVAIKL